jgi:hypothetical protein
VLSTQTTKVAPRGRRADDAEEARLVDVPLTLDLFPADAVRLIPMQFRPSDVPVVETDPGHALHLASPPAPVQSPKASSVAQGVARSDHFELADLSDDLGEVRQSRESSHPSWSSPNTEFSGEPAALPSLVRCNSLLSSRGSKVLLEQLARPACALLAE